MRSAHCVKEFFFFPLLLQIPAYSVPSVLSFQISYHNLHATAFLFIIQGIYDYLRPFGSTFHEFGTAIAGRIRQRFLVDITLVVSIQAYTVGVNFSTYPEQVHMTQAKHLLETTNMKIADLYMAVGYNNLTSFRRAFKKKYGVAPNAIRE
ncbi:MAG: AraC family transcriptional regulator [Lachnospiraceae bacterium]|nr:AraC family transcriptional regulator [Lachnospiraceae bacterium]